jgi:CubicO group peptidase (beta-lactamase class C family)
MIHVLVFALQAATAPAVDSAVMAGVAAGVYPGAVVVIGTGRRVLYARGYGHFTWSSASAVPNADSTLFDLASLTKVVATTPASMVLVETGRLKLEDSVQRYLPEFVGAGKDRVTVRQLLEHRSGLRAFLPLNERAATAADARRLVLEEPLRWPPGTRVEYSDLNAMLLGWIVERVAGRPLDSLARHAVFEPLGMTSTRFRPPRALRPRIPPVGLWRGHAIAGEVHDQNAARLGGVSGHAGLYSTGADLARYAQFWLRRGALPDGRRLVRPELVEAYLRRRAGNRGFGWALRDTTTADDAGTLLSARAVGHGGYTGTSLWIDPERDLFVVLLTNRVFAPRTSRSITRLKAIRGNVADAAVALRAERCAATPGAADGC